MEINLNLPTPDDGEGAPDIPAMIERAVNKAIKKINPAKQAEQAINEPDWSDEGSIKAFIAALQEDNAETQTYETSTRSKMMDAQQVQKEVDRLLAEAVKTINEKKLEIQAKVQQAEARRRNNNSRITQANEFLADLYATQKQLEHLAELERQLKELCADLDAWDKARPYQVDGILLAVSAFMNEKRGFLDADEMGLGKTFKATVIEFIIRALFIRKHGREPKVLWVTKRSLIKSNFREIRRWNPNIKAVPNLGTTPETREQFYNIAMMTESMLVSSYEHIRDTEIIRRTKWDFVFADEVHKLKGGANPKPTLIWQVVKEVCERASFIYFLSGTPIVNRGEEMWAYLHIFDSVKFPSTKNFLYRYMDAYYDHNGNACTKVNVDRLMNALVGQMIHRTKKEVGMQLPDKERVFYYLEMGEAQRAVYNQMRDNLYVWLDSKDKTTALSANVIIAQINRLRQIALYPKSLHTKNAFDEDVYLDVDESVKVDQAFDLIDQIDDQVVVFSSQFNPPMFELERRLTEAGKKVVVISGNQKMDTGDAEQAFQQQEIDVLIINMQTGSEGLNLHKSPNEWPGGASHAIFLDLWWNPAKNVQAEDRIWRDGVVEPVTIHILQCEDSADAFVAAKVQEKAETIGQIMERNELRPPSEWRDLLEGLI